MAHNPYQSVDTSRITNQARGESKRHRRQTFPGLAVKTARALHTSQDVRASRYCQVGYIDLIEEALQVLGAITPEDWATKVSIGEGKSKWSRNCC
jgi:hypothetical protein